MKFKNYLSILLLLFLFTWGVNAQITRPAEAKGGFGYAVSMSGDGTRMAVSAPYNWIDIYKTTNKGGKVFVFNLVNGNWVLDPKFNYQGNHADERYGESVAMSEDGNLIAVGAPGAKKVHLYVRWGNGDWKPAGMNADPTRNIIRGSTEEFGKTLDIVRTADGKLWCLAIGAPANKGKVELWRADGPVWQWNKWSELTGTQDKGRFGNSISMISFGSGIRIAIGAPNRSSHGFGSNGAVDIYEADYNQANPTWIQRWKGLLHGTKHNELYGFDIALDPLGREFILVGCKGQNIPGFAAAIILGTKTGGSRTADVILKDITIFDPKTKASEEFGRSVAIGYKHNKTMNTTERHIIVGANNHDVSKGAVYIYKEDAPNTFNLVSMRPGAQSGYLGYSLDASYLLPSNTSSSKVGIVVGAWLQDTKQGNTFYMKY